MEPLKPIISFAIGPVSLDITPDMVVQWVIIILIAILAWWATRDLKVKPGKKQAAVETIYTSIKSVVDNNVGEEYSDIIPFVGCLGIYILLMNLVGLVGVIPPTKNFSVTLGMAIISFVAVNGYAIRKHGMGGYIKGYAQPIPVMLPINLLERIMLPVSLSLRLFGNVLAATFIIELVYENLHKLAFIAQVGLPVPLHAYFDIFDGVIQMVIFVMLTMINIKIVSEH
ncbi:F0F1 ATP synthase subunit A [Clostridium sp.]|uniref:F0F1 ATP synthase subunit A n=1 Tax=Clostridium sp. TaxID=1506 RepID=UPI003F341925